MVDTPPKSQVTFAYATDLGTNVVSDALVAKVYEAFKHSAVHASYDGDPEKSAKIVRVFLELSEVSACGVRRKFWLGQRRRLSAGASALRRRRRRRQRWRRRQGGGRRGAVCGSVWRDYDIAPCSEGDGVQYSHAPNRCTKPVKKG